MIRYYNAGTEVRVDAAVRDAIFLRENPGWKPEDLGYPPHDYILIDLMRQIKVRRG